MAVNGTKFWAFYILLCKMYRSLKKKLDIHFFELPIPQAFQKCISITVNNLFLRNHNSDANTYSSWSIESQLNL